MKVIFINLCWTLGNNDELDDIFCILFSFFSCSHAFLLVEMEMGIWGALCGVYEMVELFFSSKATIVLFTPFIKVYSFLLFVHVTLLFVKRLVLLCIVKFFLQVPHFVRTWIYITLKKTSFTLCIPALKQYHFVCNHFHEKVSIHVIIFFCLIMFFTQNNFCILTWFNSNAVIIEEIFCDLDCTKREYDNIYTKISTFYL